MRRSEARRDVPERRGAEVKIPHDPVNEQVVIAAALVGDEKTRSSLLTSIQPDAFFGKGHQKIWETVRQLEQRKLTFDPATIRQISDAEVDTTYLENLIRERPATPPNLSYHVQCLLWDQMRIETARGVLPEFLEALRDVTTEPERLRTLARAVGNAFTSNLQYLRDTDSLMRSVRRNLERRRSGQAIYPFGLEGFDTYGYGEELAGKPRVVPGTAPGKVTVITGVPGSGKSTTVASIVVAQVRAQRKVLYGAWEMGAEISLELCAGIDLGMSRTAISTGMLTTEEESMFLQRCEELAAWIKFFELPFGRKRGEKVWNDQNLDLIHGYIVASGCDVFVADLWRRAIRQFDPDEEEAALYRQQAIANETNTHHILLHQQRAKDLELRPDKRPTREAIKGSGAWIEVPDTIIGVHTPAQWKNVPNDKCELILLKQRYGKWPLAVEFDYDPDVGQLLNGRSVEYTRPGDSDPIDSFLDQDRKKDRKNAGGRRRL